MLRAFKGKRRNELLYAVIIVLIVLSIMQPIFEFKGSIFVHEDTPFIGLTYPLKTYLQDIHSSFFLYNNLDYTGNLQPSFNSPLSYVFSLIFLPFTVINGIIGNILTNILFLLIGSLGMFALIYMLFKENDYPIRIFAGFVGALVFFPFIEPFSSFLPLCLIFILMLTRKIANNEFSLKKSYYEIVGCVFSFAFLFATGSEVYLIQNFMFLFLLIIFMALLLPSNKFKLLIVLLSVFAIGLLANLSMITEAYFLSLSHSANIGFYAFVGAPLKYAFGNSNVLYALQILDYGQGSSFFIAGKLFFFLLSILGLVYFIKKWHTHNQTYVIILSLFIVFIILTFFYNTIFKPFGSIFDILIQHFKFLYAIRYGNGSFVYIFEFILGILSATATVSYISYFKNNPRVFVPFSLVVLLIGFVILYYTSFSPYINSSYYYVSIPKHVYALSNYLNNQSGDFSVAVLPVAAGFQYLESWYTGPDIYSYLINRPVYTGGYIAQTEIFYPITKYFYDNIALAIDNSNTINDNYIPSLLGIAGVKYIIVQGNAVDSSPYDLNYSDSFSFNNIYINLNKSYGIKFVQKYANSSLYLNLNYLPLVYPTNIFNIKNSSSLELYNKLSNSSSDIKNNSIFITSISGFYNDSNTINATSISNFSQPDVSFVENTPTKVTVHIKNATTPYYLIFRETYDPRWAAFFSNGTKVNPRDHIAVNGFANAWYMNKTGNYTVTLYYTLQTDAWLTWAVSFAALFATVGIGVYGWRRDRAHA